MRQWSLSLPGACEGPCHWRGTIEPLAANGMLEPLVSANLDLVKVFGNAEGSLSLDRVATPSRLRHLPPHRCQLRHQPGGEQGDVLGTVQSALVLGQARDAHLGEFLSNPLEAKGVCDEWFVEDWKVFIRPFQFDPFLRALDSEKTAWGFSKMGSENLSQNRIYRCAPLRVT